METVPPAGKNVADIYALLQSKQ